MTMLGVGLAPAITLAACCGPRTRAIDIPKMNVTFSTSVFLITELRDFVRFEAQMGAEIVILGLDAGA